MVKHRGLAYDFCTNNLNRWKDADVRLCWMCIRARIAIETACS